MASRLAAGRDANRVIDELERIAFGEQAATGGRDMVNTQLALRSPPSSRRSGI
jgi:hypothetical protein